MKRTVRENIHAAYSLHDMNIIAIETDGDDMIMKSQMGMVRTVPPYDQVDGHVEFKKVDFDFSHVYLLEPTGNSGSFTGEKMGLREFLEAYQIFGFSVIDEVYGYNQTKYWGYLTAKRMVRECIIEIYHEGDMVFVEE